MTLRKKIALQQLVELTIIGPPQHPTRTGAKNVLPQALKFVYTINIKLSTFCPKFEKRIYTTAKFFVYSTF